MSELPANWTSLPLATLCGSEGMMADGDWIETKDQDPHGKVRLIQLADIGDGVFLDKSSRFLTKTKARELGCTFLEPGDVLIARMPDPLGRACIFPGGDREAVTAVDVCIWRPWGEESADAHWLKYIINSPQVRAQIALLAGGTTRQRISGGNLKKLELPTPPRSEQRHIVGKLDSLFAHSKTIREELGHIPKLVERYKQAILAAAFSGQLTADWRAKTSAKRNRSLATDLAETRSAYCRRARIPEKPGFSPSWIPNLDLPETWEVVSVDQLAVLVQYGSSAKTSEALTRGVPVLRMGNIFEGKLDYTKLKYLPASHHEFPDLLLQDGDVLFNRTNSAELVGKSAVYSDPGHRTSFASYLIRLRIVGYLPELLSAYINAELGRAWIRSVVNQQVGQANVNGTKLRELGVPLMPIEEQREIWSRINDAFTRIEHLSREATRAAELLERLDQATLAKAFRGELVAPQQSVVEARSAGMGRRK